MDWFDREAIESRVGRTITDDEFREWCKLYAEMVMRHWSEVCDD